MSYLFKLEDVLVEVVLETLVGKVDAELFEAVVLIILKPKNVKHSNGQDLRMTNKNRKKKEIFNPNIHQYFKILETGAPKR